MGKDNDTNIGSFNPEFQEKVKALMSMLNRMTGYQWIIVQGYRSIEYQNELYAQGRTKPGQIVTNAMGGSSPHNYGLAVDVAPLDPKNPKKVLWSASEDVWRKMGEIAASIGLEWGGNFTKLKDRPHVQMPSWRRLGNVGFVNKVVNMISKPLAEKKGQFKPRSLTFLEEIELTVHELTKK